MGAPRHANGESRSQPPTDDTDGGERARTDADPDVEPDNDRPTTNKTVVLGGVDALYKAPRPAIRPPDNTRAVGPTEGRAAHRSGVARRGLRHPSDDEPTGPRPRHLRTDGLAWRRPAVTGAAVPLLVLTLLIVSWAIDSAALSGQVVRNLEVAGHSVGGLSEDSLPEVIGEVADEVAQRPVLIRTDDQTFETTAGDIGLTLDEDATAEAALSFGRRDALVARPFTWLGSFFGSRHSSLHYSVSETAVGEELAELQGGNVVEPTEPSIRLTDQGFSVVPGQPGEGINAQQVAKDLLAAADDETAAPTDEIEVAATDKQVSPVVSDEDARKVAERANALTADGLTVVVNDTEVRFEPSQLREWIKPLAVDDEVTIDTVNRDLANQEVAAAFASLRTEPENARVELQSGTPTVIPGHEGVTCCAKDSVKQIWQALDRGESTVTLEAKITKPEITTEAAEGWGIKEPIGGSRAWRDGAPIDGPRPGFTTFHVPGQSRVTNIQRMADIVNGAVVPPGESFSINEHVGARTIDKGFVPSGAINEGQHVEEVGGGVSQFATTFFNAAYFAGVDITTARAHTEYFSRYPRGREATMGSPGTGLDVRFVNDTPHGILIQTSHTADSVTVTFWSTTYAKAEQTGISESANGQCDVVTTTRTIEYPDRETRTETWSAQYRPGDNLDCQGNKINPEPEEDGEGQ